jgi:hypothetical protein
LCEMGTICSDCRYEIRRMTFLDPGPFFGSNPKTMT